MATTDKRVRRIESLTPEQKSTFPEWEKKWLRHGLSTAPLSGEEWERVRVAAVEVARLSGLPEPVLIRVSSPLAASIAAPVAAFVAARSGVRSGVWSGVWAGVWSGIGG